MSPERQLHRAVAALAARADPAIVVRLRWPRPEVVWSSAAAADLLGAECGQWREPPTHPVADRPSHWSVVVEELATRPGAADERWHPASRGGDAADDEAVQVHVAAVEDAPELRLVRFRRVPVDVDEGEAAAEFRFRSLAENAPIGVLVSEVGARLAFVNDCFAAIAATTPADLLGTGWLDAFEAQSRRLLLESLEDVLAGEAKDLTLQLRAGEGQSRWIQLRLSPVLTQQRAAGFVGTVEDITIRRGRELELTYHASHDSLTGQLNRRQVVETLSGWLVSRRRSERELAVLFCDLDGFKQVNDGYGHEAGDRVLIEVARRMSTIAREEDLVARNSGDEFVIVLRNVTEASEARASAGRFRDALARPIELGAVSVRVSMSIGISLAREHSTVEELLRQADTAMYAAKQAGGGVVCADTAADHPDARALQAVAARGGLR